MNSHQRYAALTFRNPRIKATKDDQNVKFVIIFMRVTCQQEASLKEERKIKKQFYLIM